jgi:putative ABC transport system permease protein
MTLFQRDVRFGLRLLAKNPGFTAVAVLALALGIAANTAIFSVVYATLLEPLPYHDPEQLVMVWSKPQPDSRNSTAAGDFLDWRAQSTVFQGLHAWGGRSVSLATADRPEQVQAALTTPGWITNFGLRFQAGRDFLPEEGEVGKDQVVVLSDSVWQERFGGDREIVGSPIRIDGKPYTVVGILEAGPADRVQHRLYLPLAFTPDQINHDFHWLLVMGRLKPGVTLEQANAEMSGIAARIAEAYPAQKKGWGISVEPLQNNFLARNTILGLWLLLAAVGFVLLIACANVANLLLARGTARQREVAVRASMGAARKHLFAQFLTESVVLAGMGGVLGVGLAAVFMRVILAMMPPFTLPSEAHVRLSIPVLLFTLAAAMLAGILFGCAPAWQATRLHLSDTLKETSRSSFSGGRHRLRRALVVSEFALALTLLAGGGIAIHSLLRLSRVDLGFRTERLLTFFLPVPQARLAGEEQVTAFYRRMLEQIQVSPGIASASVSTGIPVQGIGFGMGFDIVGKPAAEGSARPGAGFNMVTPEYFRTLGIPIVQGRALTEQDVAGSAPVCVVNESFVKRHLAGLDPLTQRVSVQRLIPGQTTLGPPVEWQIVGVFRDVRNRGPQNEIRPEIDVPFWQSPWPSAAVAVRTTGDPGSARNSLAAIVRSMDPDLPMADVRTMDQIVDERLAGDRFNAMLFGSFAGIALLLAAVGIYGVMSFVVAQRTHELGLRMALGASKTQVLQLVMKDGMSTALVGTAIGFVGAYLVGRAMQAMFSGVAALDVVRFGAVAATLLASALLACYVPARRATRVDPLSALREE